VLRHIRLLIFDLDYLLYDCSALKARAIREVLVPFADEIPQDVSLPDAVDAQEGFLSHGTRWTRFLQIGLNDDRLTVLENLYRLQEQLLAAQGAGRLYPAIPEFIRSLRDLGTTLAIGAEAGRDYLLAVSDRNDFDALFAFAFCTEEFGMGSADEMIEDLMERAEVNPSETLLLGTRPDFFRAARRVDVASLGCGWGLEDREALAEADFQALTPSQAFSIIQEADIKASEPPDS
jgi:phosphoglycolate phosphatase-like HAD superfamily hydrolase